MNQEDIEEIARIFGRIRYERLKEIADGKLNRLFRMVLAEGFNRKTRYEVNEYAGVRLSNVEWREFISSCKDQMIQMYKEDASYRPLDPRASEEMSALSGLTRGRWFDNTNLMDEEEG